MLEGDPREIEIRLKLIDSDGDRRIRENLESYRHLIMVEASKFNPAYIPGAMPDGAWLVANKGYIDVVLALSHMREIARQLVAAVSRFIDADPDRAAQPVTKFHLELGMRHQFLAVTILQLMSVNARG